MGNAILVGRAEGGFTAGKSAAESFIVTSAQTSLKGCAHTVKEIVVQPIRSSGPESPVSGFSVYGDCNYHATIFRLLLRNLSF